MELTSLAGKHIEIQIFGDSSGHCISLFERECSIQRRHQKVIEESPSPYMTPQLRQKMSDAATELGRLLRYEGAGTAEFIVDAKTGGFYFLEVNTRVQVFLLPLVPNQPELKFCDIWFGFWCVQRTDLMYFVLGRTSDHRRNNKSRYCRFTNLRRIRRTP
jgi:hypothetical protein